MSKRRAHYCVRVANDICTQIALGLTLKKALEKVGPLAPSMPTFWRWLTEYPEFSEKYDRARQMQADIHADQMLEFVDEVIKTPSKAAAIRVASDILKWQAEIRDAKKYGTKVVHETKAAPMKPEELKAEILRLEKELGVKATPGMNTAQKHIATDDPPSAENPAPPPNSEDEIVDEAVIVTPNFEAPEALQ